mmetsp:Transcript_33468/g.87815  ORF Transcript_33468/g.87815 Transcript_33468/m.87815 type:complete len:204 (-) Transcript_33468:94-705(-)
MRFVVALWVVLVHRQPVLGTTSLKDRRSAVTVCGEIAREQLPHSRSDFCWDSGPAHLAKMVEVKYRPIQQLQKSLESTVVGRCRRLCTAHQHAVLYRCDRYAGKGGTRGGGRRRFCDRRRARPSNLPRHLRDGRHSRPGLGHRRWRFGTTRWNRVGRPLVMLMCGVQARGEPFKRVWPHNAGPLEPVNGRRGRRHQRPHPCRL